MTPWLRFIRGAIGIGLSWAVAWAGAGFLLARVPGFSSDLPFALWFAPLGFVAGVMFSVILVALARRRSVDRASLAHYAAWGALSGLLLSGTITLAAVLRAGNWWGELRGFGPPLALGSATSAAVLLALARRTHSWRSLLVQLGAEGPGDT